MNKIAQSKAQLLVLLLGFAATALGVRSMLQQPTLILAPWFLVLLYLPLAFAAAFVAALATKKLLKSTWSSWTFAVGFTGAICLGFYAYAHKPSYEIRVPRSFAGEVRLLVSSEADNDFRITEHGIGYINRETYQRGFVPVILKDGIDITDQVNSYSLGAFSSASLTPQGADLSFDYVVFNIPGLGNNEEHLSLEELVKTNEIDTTRLGKK